MIHKLLIKLLVLSLFFTFPAFAAAKKGKFSPAIQNEMLILGLMRSFYDIQATYFRANGDFGSSQDLLQSGLIDINLAYGRKYGYTFLFAKTSVSQQYAGNFQLCARPVAHGKTGRKSFCVDAKCEIRVSTQPGYFPDQSSPILETCTADLAVENDRRQSATLRTLASAEETYAATIGAGQYAGSLNTLYAAGLINQQLATGYYQHYYFHGGATPRTATTPPKFYYQSRPLSYGVSGYKSYYIDQTGVLRAADHHGDYATVDDPPLDESEREFNLLGID